MILVQESDLTTNALVPRLADDGGRVVLDVFTDGRRTGSQAIAFTDWPERYKLYLDDGFIESESMSPDLIVVIDMAHRTVRLAGSIKNKLLDPSAGDMENPIDQLVVQADDILAEARYVRVTNWFAGDGDTRFAVAVTSVPTDIPLDLYSSARAAFTPAVAAIRSQFDPTDPEQVADWLTFAEDPFGRDFSRRIVAIQQRLLGEARVATGGVPAAIGHLYSAIMAATGGNIGVCIASAGKVKADLGI